MVWPLWCVADFLTRWAWNSLAPIYVHISLHDIIMSFDGQFSIYDFLTTIHLNH